MERAADRAASRQKEARRPALFGWWGIVVLWMAWGAFNVVRFGVMPGIGWMDAVRYGFPDALIWLAFTPLVVALSHRFEIHGPERWRHLGVHAVAAILVVLAHSAIDASVSSLFAWLGHHGMPWKLVFLRVLQYELSSRLLMYTFIAGFAHYQRYDRRLAEERAAASQLARQLSEARLTNLRRQLRPHFLFNALQSVAESIEGSPERGRRVVRRLGELLRASLRNDEAGPWIRLDAELDLVRAYLEIEEVRFEDRLRIDIDATPEALACSVPVLLLQPIVENAVSHGVAPRTEGGTVAVRAAIDQDRLVLEVEDDGAGWQAAARRRAGEGSGIGLRNARERLATLYGTAARLEALPGDQGGARVRIILPLRRSQAA